MRWQIVRVLFVVMMIMAWAGGSIEPVQSQDGQVALPSQATLSASGAISYQGFLQQDGEVVDGACDLHFTLFDAATNGGQVGDTLERANQNVVAGYFTVSDLDFGAHFTGQSLWLQVAVRCPAGSGSFTALSPRQALLPAPYALYAFQAANNWALLGNAGTNAATNFVGTTDAVSLTLKVSDTVALRLLPNAVSPSLVGGIAANIVTAGVLGAFIGGGGGPDEGIHLANRVTDNYGAIGGGGGNIAGDNSGTTVDHSFATVGGGRFNSAKGSSSTVSGGQANNAVGDLATIGGGQENDAGGAGATISGGQTNGASGASSTVGGGVDNGAQGANSTVGGGVGNSATGDSATVAGGSGNQANGASATVGGGDSNLAISAATVAGGSANQASGSAATVGGGDQNEAAGKGATIGGGSANQANGSSATVGGGFENQATGKSSTVGGGNNNQANGEFATVSGGADANASHYGEWAYATGSFDGAPGEAQASLYILRGTTTDATVGVLNLNSASDLLTIAPGRTVVFDIQVAARSTGGKSAGYTARGVIENVSGTTQVLGVTVTATAIQEDDGSWGVIVKANDTNDSLKIEVTGSVGDTIRWVATVRTTEVQN